MRWCYRESDNRARPATVAVAAGVVLRITESLIRICNSDRRGVCASPTSTAA